jgi:hypothetical protein
MKIKCYGWKTNNDSYKSYTIIPTILFCIDKQMLEKFHSNGEDFGGVLEYSLIFCWLNFDFAIEIEIKK